MTRVRMRGSIMWANQAYSPMPTDLHGKSGRPFRRRADWTRHFTLSGGLTVMSAVGPSDAAGLLKEELDADGGSGFSFGDLMADRAGTTFAEKTERFSHEP